MNTSELASETFTWPHGTGWRVRIPEGRPLATPAVGHGRVFVGGGYGSHEFYAFDADTGRLAWRLHTNDDGPTAAVIADGCVAFNTESCTLYVVEAETGREVWSRWLGDPLMAQPAIAGERLFMAYPAKGGEHRLAAFELRTGRPMWEAELAHDIITAPVVAGGSVYASLYTGEVACFDAASGKRLWSRDLQATSAPWIRADEVLVSRREEGRPGRAPREYTNIAVRQGSAWRDRATKVRRATYLRSRRGTQVGTVMATLDASVGFAAAPAAAKIETAEGLTGNFTVAECWAYQGSRPCAAGERVYETVGDVITCTGRTNRRAWERPFRSRRAGARAVSPVAVAGSRVYLGTGDGRVLSLDAETGRRRWSAKVGAPIAWQPAVAGGRVYAGCEDGTLVAIATGDPGDDGWPMWGGGPGHNGPEGA